MQFTDHPDRPGWKVGPEVTELAAAPLNSPLEGMLGLIGLGPDDWRHRLYLVPASTLVEDLVEFFRIGSRSCERTDFNEWDTMDLVAGMISEIESVVPGDIEFADPTALRFRFARPLEPEEALQIETIFEEADEEQASLGRHSRGANPSFAELQESGLLGLWWE